MVELNKVMLYEYEGKEKFASVITYIQFVITFIKVPYFGDSFKAK